MSPHAQTLEREVETYKKNLPKLTASEGKFALVHKDEFVDVYDAYQDALKAGYEKFGLSPFLVKKISALENIAYFSREIK